MSGEMQEVRIVGVNREAITMSGDKKDYWVVPFKLSVAPDQFWQKKFYEVQQKDPNPLKRKARFSENIMNTDIFITDDLQKALDVLKVQVEQTNVLCEEDYERKLKIREEVIALKKKQSEKTQQFQQDSDTLNF